MPSRRSIPDRPESDILRTTRRAFLLSSLGALASACTVVPYDGPLERDIVREAAFVGKTETDFTYGLVDLDAASVKVLDDYFKYHPFSATFGFGSSAAGIRIGVGDVLEITIFEAGPDGLFSTTERKQVSLPLTVQSDGRISVPYAGTIQAAGRTSEQIRGSILAVLRERAVEPDVIVNLRESVSRTVTVNSGAGGSGVVPLLAGNERVLDVIARAGAVATPPYETVVSLSRGGQTCTALLQALIDKPRENIFVKPGDTIFLSEDERTFAAFGAVDTKGLIEFNEARLSLAEAAALARGVDANRANPKGYFVFRYEREAVVQELADKHVIEAEELHALIADPHVRDKHGQLPMVYRIDLSSPDSLFIAKQFEMRDKDIIYAARSFGTDLARFLALVGQTNATVRSLVAT